MQITWHIEYYESPAGNKPVEEFINDLQEKAQNKIVRTLELLEEFGITIGMPHAKKVAGTPLWELRILGSDSLRIFYIAKEQKSFLLLHVFKKKMQKTEKKEIKSALERLREYQSRKNNYKLPLAISQNCDTISTHGLSNTQTTTDEKSCF